MRVSVAAAARSAPSGDQPSSATAPRGKSVSGAADADSGGGGAPIAPRRASAVSSAAPSVAASKSSRPPVASPTASMLPSGEKARARAGAGSGRSATIECERSAHRRTVASSPAVAARSRDGWHARPANSPGQATAPPATAALAGPCPCSSIASSPALGSRQSSSPPPVARSKRPRGSQSTERTVGVVGASGRPAPSVSALK
mmetsp:Transcript_11367/g.35053  ORF Transcript_11367/g.35053 Transcript_11367/m.35053 type:complete len:202 (+) Transcript_11367:826-1431(+)|eukprot:scaffold184669_cov26-Tisochrysis_lutea.AAC.7